MPVRQGREGKRGGEGHGCGSTGTVGTSTVGLGGDMGITIGGKVALAGPIPLTASA